MGWVTIKTYNFGIEATMAQHLLENEGIETHLMDELSIQTNPLYSNALGGVKLQVWEEDVERAMQVLHAHSMLQNEDMQRNGIDMGYGVLEDDVEIPTDGELEKEVPVDTSKAISRWSIAVILATVIGGAAVLSYCLTPNTEERLYSNYWCVNYALVGKDTYYPNTLETRIILSGECNEKINFMRTGKVLFPGFNTPASFGIWQMNRKGVNITLYDSSLHVFNGFYKPEFNGDNLMLRGEHVFISATTVR